MAKFVDAVAPGGSVLYRINVDQVCYVQQGKNDKNRCVIKFGDDRVITVEMSADDFVARLTD